MKMKLNVWLRIHRGFSSQPTLKKFEDLPGPRLYPIVGNLPELKIFGMSNKLEIKIKI